MTNHADEHDQFARGRLLYGNEGIESLQKMRVAVFGLGGVGGYVAESLVRTGIGAIVLIDHDTVDTTNLNRQIIATHETIGMNKTDAMEQRLLSINPACCITKHECFYLPETADAFDLTEYDYVIDAVDTVTAKLELITRATQVGTPIISAMGAGNKTDPTALRIDDIYHTSVCPLARIMRKELRKRSIKNLTVCYSLEAPVSQESNPPQSNPAGKVSTAAKATATESISSRRSTPGSNAFVPSAMGLAMAAHVVNELIRESQAKQ